MPEVNRDASARVMVDELAAVLREGVVVVDDVYREASARDMLEPPPLDDVLRDGVDDVLRDAVELEPDVLMEEVCREASARDIVILHTPLITG